MKIVGFQRDPVSPHIKFGTERPPTPQFTGAEQALAYPVAHAASKQALHKMSKSGSLLNHVTDWMVPIFQRITEVYIAGFVAQDVVGLWMPRIWTSAKTGRIEYDPSQDPEAKNKPFKDQVKMWLKGNIKGLNWVNLQEETAREAATGPGLLVIPSALYVLASRTIGRSGIHLGHEALNGMSNGFREHLETTPLRHAGADIKIQDYRREMGNYIASIFQDAELRKTAMPGGGTYGAFLDDWSKRWAEAMETEGGKAGRKKQEAALSQLSGELQEKLTAFNQAYRLRPYQLNGKTIGASAGDSLLHRVDYIWTGYGKQGELRHTPISQITKELTKWTDVSKGIFKQTEKLAGAADTKLPEVVEFVRRKVIAHKALFGISSTLLGAAYLFQLVFWTQRNKSYQATRLLHEDQGSDKKAAPAPAQAAPLSFQAQTPMTPNAFANQAALPGGQA